MQFLEDLDHENQEPPASPMLKEDLDKDTMKEPSSRIEKESSEGAAVPLQTEVDLLDQLN